VLSSIHKYTVHLKLLSLNLRLLSVWLTDIIISSAVSLKIRVFLYSINFSGISKDLEDLISLNSEFSTAAGVYDMNDNRKSNASWMTPRTVGTEAGRDIGTHRTKERRKETEQPRGRYRQTEPREERPSYYRCAIAYWILVLSSGLF